MIEVKNLSKHYGTKKAVDDISFTVKKGEILGFLGPNGAGKTTTLNMLTGYISRTSGSITINGMDIVEKPGEVKKCIGYLPEQPPLYPDMTVCEYLSFVYDLKKAEGNKNEHIAEICEIVKITDVMTRLIKNLSKGYKQRVGLAQALIGNPEILILDEPTVGLDPAQIIEIRNVIKSLGSERTIIFSSHILGEISAICEKIIIINNGKIVADNTTENLSHTKGKEYRYIVRIKGDKAVVVDVLRGIDGIVRANSKATDDPEVFDYGIECTHDIREDMFYVLAKTENPILALRQREMTLEETFINITTGSYEGVK